jgi:hypothetical protein
MRRRELVMLAGTGVAGVLGGCSIPFTGGGGDGGDGGDGGNGTPTPTLPPISEAVEITNAELVRSDEGTFAETVSLEGTAENTSDVALRDVQIRVDFLDENGEVLSQRATSPRDVSSGRTWSFAIQYHGNGSEARAVDDFNVTAGTEFAVATATADCG